MGMRGEKVCQQRRRSGNGFATFREDRRHSRYRRKLLLYYRPMWNAPWNYEEWVISRGGLRYLTLAFWGQVPFILLCPLLVYWAYLPLFGKPTPLMSHSYQVLFGLIGGTYALACVILDRAMHIFQRSRSSSGTYNSLWRAMLALSFLPGGLALYFWFVYRRQMRESEFS